LEGRSKWNHQPLLDIACSLNSPAFYNVFSAGICPDQLNNYVSESLTDSIQRYHTDNSTKAAWDSIQSFLQCCGVNGTSDWAGHPPASCPLDPQVQGCYAKAKLWFHSNFLHIGIITICVCVIQVLGMSFALTLNCQIDKTSQALGL